MAEVELRRLTKRYGASVAVDDVSLTIPDGQLICLLGPSGCGKTTTLRLIAGFMEPTGGEISVGGRVLSAAGKTTPPEARNMSMIFQSYALWPHMTVAENVAYGLKLRRMDAATIATKLKEILATTKLETYAARYPGELSGGQQQRVSLARALVIEPETLLLDEPLSNLDANLREEMRFEIRRLHDEFKITTVYVTHDQAEAMVTSDRIVVMNKGHIEQVDAPHVLYGRPRSRFVAGFIGRTNFIEGRPQGSNVAFDGFKVPASAVEQAGSGTSFYSLRPQAIALAADRPAGAELAVASEITARAYLGEYWDYQVRPLGGTQPLRVATGPNALFEVGQRVWLEIDPAAMVRVE